MVIFIVEENKAHTGSEPQRPEVLRRIATWLFQEHPTSVYPRALLARIGSQVRGLIINVHK